MRLAPFQEVVERHGRDVMRLCIAVAGPGAADDCYQETMLAALTAYPRLRDPSVTRSWLLTIASRKAIDGFRASARTVPVAEPDAGATEDAELPDAQLWARVRSLPPSSASRSPTGSCSTSPTRRSARPWTRARRRRGATSTRA